jgi:hypothetical protein
MSLMLIQKTFDKGQVQATFDMPEDKSKPKKYPTTKKGGLSVFQEEEK